MQSDLLRFITCGSVDDGKSTLIGRLLYDTKQIFEDQLQSVVNDSKKYGTTGAVPDLALLVDGLQSEREQGITIDVAYRFFSTPKRSFIIADTPGHEQYTRNMATGASNVDSAIILIDARYGIQKQTRRHLYIAALLGIKYLVVAVNKMDLVEYSEERFLSIQNEMNSLLPLLPYHDQLKCTFIPLSALLGENVVHKSNAMPWYKGKTLIQILENIPLLEQNSDSFRFPVQYVNRPHADFRGYCGTIASGTVHVGDSITVLPSGKTTCVKEILAPSIQPKPLQEACFPMAITMTTEDEIDICRGDMVVHSNHLPRVSNSLKVMVVWMSEKPLHVEEPYMFKVGTAMVEGSFEHINYKVDVNTYTRTVVDVLELNDIASCKLILTRAIPIDPYHTNRFTGSFIIIDRMSNLTVGAGMIVNASRRDTQEISLGHRVYSEAEIALNAFIRTNFPEWECKSIHV